MHNDHTPARGEERGGASACRLAGGQKVPSRGGRSHAADEYTSFDAIAAGADVLLASLLELARGDRP